MTDILRQNRMGLGRGEFSNRVLAAGYKTTSTNNDPFQLDKDAGPYRLA